MPGHDGPPEEFVESTLANGSREALDELIAVLAARRGCTAADIAELAGLPREDVDQWIDDVEEETKAAGPMVGRLDRVETAIREIAGAETVDGIVQPLAAVAGDVLGSTDVVVYRYDGLRDEFVPAVRAEDGGFEPEPIDADDDRPWAAFQSDEVTFLDSAELVVPAGVFGIVRVGDVDPDEVSDHDLASFRPVASAAAGAIARIRRIRSLEGDREELRRENEQLRDFASIVSHDLRNPLSVAEGAFEMVVESDDEEYVQKVRDAHDRIDGIIDHTLSLAKEGKRIDDAEPVDLETVAWSAWRAVDTGGATLGVEDTTTVDADPERLRQVFENLFRNAVEHGGASVEVRVGTTGDGFYVADDGPGIPESVRDRIFERGYTSEDDGTGLGLHIVREIAEGHRWTISIDESEDGGARFEFANV